MASRVWINLRRLDDDLRTGVASPGHGRRRAAAGVLDDLLDVARDIGRDVRMQLILHRRTAEEVNIEVKQLHPKGQKQEAHQADGDQDNRDHREDFKMAGKAEVQNISLPCLPPSFRYAQYALGFVIRSPTAAFSRSFVYKQHNDHREDNADKQRLREADDRAPSRRSTARRLR